MTHNFQWPAQQAGSLLLVPKHLLHRDIALSATMRALAAWVLGPTVLLGGLCAIPVSRVEAASPPPKMLFNTADNCKRITGYGKHDLLGVAMGYKVPLDSVRFVKAEWGRNQAGGYQCNMVFTTPSGRKHCTVFNIVQAEFIFGQAVTIPGNKAICFDPKR